MSTIRGPLLALICAALACSVAAAQGTNPNLREVSPNQRQGFWAGLGVGAGSEAYNLRGDARGYSRELTAPTFSIKLGGTLNQNFRLGGELFAWVSEERNGTQALGAAMLIGQWYPVSRAGFFVKGGLGIARNEFDPVNNVSFGDTGIGGVVGVGYELRVGRRVGIAPTLDFIQQSYSGRTYTTYHERVVSAGVSVVFNR